MAQVEAVGLVHRLLPFQMVVQEEEVARIRAPYLKQMIWAVVLLLLLEQVVLLVCLVLLVH